MKEIPFGHAGFLPSAIMLGLLCSTPVRAQSLSVDDGRGGGMGVRVRPAAPPAPAPRTVRLEDILPASVNVVVGPVTNAPFIRGQVKLAGVAATRVPVSIVALGGETPQNLLRLQMAFEALKQEVAADTAPVRLRSPAVYGAPGFNRDPVIKSSAGDVERAEASADLRARKALETFLRQSRAKTITCGNPDEFLFRGPRPGRYLVCLVADVRDPQAGRSARARPMIWWADVTLGEAQAAAFAFTADDARSWRDLFPR